MSEIELRVGDIWDGSNLIDDLENVDKKFARDILKILELKEKGLTSDMLEYVLKKEAK